ncbi:hypothetical protein ACP70R_036679 [Stipagrostis hirtigluma subsp. patula]
MAAAGQGGAAAAFRPDDHELVDRFLRRKLDGEPLLADGACFIHDVDVCSAAPGDLAGTYAPAPGAAADRPVWYFFSPARYVGPRPRNSLHVGSSGGIWRLASYPEPVKGSAAGGSKRHLLYMERSAESDNFYVSKWLMAEYSIPKNAGEGLVLCKVYTSPRPSRQRP